MILTTKGCNLTKSTAGRNRIGKKTTISIPDEMFEFIASERRLAESVVGAAPSELDMIRMLLERARKSIELERKLEQSRNLMAKE